jgi:hypothetical protein
MAQRAFGVRWVARCPEPGVEGQGHDVSVGDGGLGVVASDASLELEDFGDGVVELAVFGVPVADDVQRVGCGVRASSAGWNSVSSASAI